MYQVQAIWEGMEIGYGEAEVYEDAAQEASESVDEMYPDDEVFLLCTHGIMTVKTPLNVWNEFA